MKKLLQVSLLISCFFFSSSFTNHIEKNNISVPKEFKLNNGKIIKIDDLEGKIILLDFWYRGCLPCVKSIPELIKLQDKYQDDIVIIGINDSDNQKDVTNYLNYKKANYLSTYKMKNNISKELDITAFPTTIIIDKKGEIVQTVVGFDTKEIKKTIKALKKKY